MGESLGRLTATVAPRGRRRRATASGGTRSCVRGDVARSPHGGALLRASTSRPASSSSSARLPAPRCSRSTRGAKVEPRHGLGDDRRRGARADAAAFERDHERIDDAQRPPRRARSSILLAARRSARRSLSSARLWLLRARARHRLRPRVRAGAADRHSSPALVPPLLRQAPTPGSNEFTATLFDLIRRGRYTATPVTTERSIWGGLRHEDVADLELAPGERDRQLTPFEERGRRRSSTRSSTDGRSGCRASASGSRTTASRTQALHGVQGERRRRRSTARKWFTDAGAVPARPRRSSCSSVARGRAALGRRSTAGARSRRAGATSS